MVWVRTKVRPRAPRRAPKIIKNWFLVLPEGQIHVFPRYFDGRYCGFERSLGALGGSKGRPGGAWGLQSWFWEGSGRSQKRGHRIWRLPGGVWEPTLAIPRRVHMRQTHIFTTFFDDFQKRRFLRIPQKSLPILRRLEGVFASCGSMGPPQESAFTFFWAPGGSLGAAKARTMTNFEVNPRLVFKVLFFVF